MEQETEREAEVLVKRLHDKDSSPREIYHAIEKLGDTNFRGARSEIEQFLTNRDPELRMVALKVLTRYWQLPEHWKTAVQFLEKDPDSDCRMKGANALGYLKMNTSDLETLRVLARFVKNEEEDPFVREAAYAAMRKVLRYDPKEQLQIAAKGVDMIKGVDWEMVNRYVS